MLLFCFTFITYSLYLILKNSDTLFKFSLFVILAAFNISDPLNHLFLLFLQFQQLFTNNLINLVFFKKIDFDLHYFCYVIYSLTMFLYQLLYIKSNILLVSLPLSFNFSLHSDNFLFHGYYLFISNCYLLFHLLLGPQGLIHLSLSLLLYNDTLIKSILVSNHP